MKAVEMIMLFSAVLQVLGFLIILAMIPSLRSETKKTKTEQKKAYVSPFIEFTDEDTAFLLEYTRRTQDLSDVEQRPN